MFLKEMSPPIMALVDVGCSMRGEGCFALNSLPVIVGIDEVVCKDPCGFVTPSTIISPVVVGVNAL